MDALVLKLLRCVMAVIVLAGCAPSSPEVTQSVASHGEVEPDKIDGQLDCGAGAITWEVQSARVAGASGAASPEEALHQELTRYLADGEQLRIDGGVGTLISGDREVVRSTVEGSRETGGFFANPVSGCEGDKIPR